MGEETYCACPPGLWACKAHTHKERVLRVLRGEETHISKVDVLGTAERWVGRRSPRWRLWGGERNDRAEEQDSVNGALQVGGGD